MTFQDCRDCPVQCSVSLEMGWSNWARFWNENCDPRTTNQWLMSGGPGKLAAITGAYVLMIILGRVFMKNRLPFQARLPMFAYNVGLVVINAYFFYKSFWWTNYGKELLNFRFPPNSDRSPRALEITNLFSHYLLSKFVDYFDTLFFILRKKNNQITALHVYHHISVPMVGWLSNWVNLNPTFPMLTLWVQISPTMPVLGFFVMLNSACHILMYSYYAMTALGKWLQPYLWWKPYITQIQLIQFMLIGLYGILLNALHTGYPLIYRMMPISQAAIYLIMFGNFYISSYVKPNKEWNVNKGFIRVLELRGLELYWQ